MRRCLVLFVLLVSLLTLCACVKHTYYVELTNGKNFYVDSPLLLDADAGIYTMISKCCTTMAAKQDDTCVRPNS